MPKVSIIVPVYNTEKYLAQCIDSILAQTFSDFELILVNDGSKDNSGKICDEYAQKDSRIVVINKENGGVNAARRDGVDNAMGEWISFVDSDDTITCDAIETLVKNASNDIDIIIGQFRVPKQDIQVLTAIEYRKLLLNGIMVYPVAKLYRRSSFTKETFDIPKEISIGEDMLMNIKLAFFIKRDVKILPHIIYNYIYRENSAIHSRKHSIEYETLFWEQLKKAIPTNERSKYEPQLFHHIYNQWKTFCEYRIKPSKEWYESELNHFLLTNFPKYKTTIPYINRILINSKNSFIRFLLISLKKINNRLPKN